MSTKTARAAGAQAGETAEAAAERTKEFVTFSIGGQMFGIHVLKVQDVLGSMKTTRVPLAPPEIAGSLNLRGRIVTAIDVRLRLGLPPRDDDSASMAIVVEHDHELYSLLVDQVGEVLALPTDGFERNPPTLDARIRDYSDGIHRLDKQLLVLLSVERLLDYGRAAA
jgi:purine-binding chemotaxis protein CheW